MMLHNLFLFQFQLKRQIKSITKEHLYSIFFPSLTATKCTINHQRWEGTFSFREKKGAFRRFNYNDDDDDDVACARWLMGLEMKFLAESSVITSVRGMYSEGQLHGDISKQELLDKSKIPSNKMSRWSRRKNPPHRLKGLLRTEMCSLTFTLKQQFL